MRSRLMLIGCVVLMGGCGDGGGSANTAADSKPITDVERSNARTAGIMRESIKQVNAEEAASDRAVQRERQR